MFTFNKLLREIIPIKTLIGTTTQVNGKQLGYVDTWRD